MNYNDLLIAIQQYLKETFNSIFSRIFLKTNLL
jgi:hypothetical protein